MSLFAVPGWSAPDQLASLEGPRSKKRKRSAVDEEDSKLHTATVNIEKLMKKLDTGKEGTKKQKKAKNKDGSRQEKPQKVEIAHKNRGDSKPKVKGKVKEPTLGINHSEDTKPAKQKQKKAKSASDPGTNETPAKATARPLEEAGLTPLQASMKASLEGARFRHFNEILYKSTSEDVQKLVHQDPSVIDDYHAGFRHQVKSWPVNPVNQYIKEIAAIKLPLVVADLGCGDAAIAQQLIPKGVSVLSFDLKSDDHYVVEADICQRIPLPGSETEETNGGQVVDVVVCALSLMGTNWMGCIREARRILKPGGNLKIAEVTSRFEDVDAFVKLVSAAGFKLTMKDDTNTHFLKFEFIKISRDKKPDWKALERKGSLLKPCEYKRR